MIRHTVVFKLKNPPTSPETNDFFTAAKKLAAIPGVQKFECMKQVSPKNNFDFGLSMEFDNATLYAQYNQHPDHVHFVKVHWANNVDDFLETDYERLP